MGGRTSRFAKTATAEEVASHFDLHGKVYVVTGGNTGLGLETVRVLVGRGARVIAGLRRPHEAGDALQLHGEEASRLELAALDLASLDSVRDFAMALRAREDLALDGIVLNAGIMGLPEYTATRDGVEAQWGVNHLGHMTLTLLLLPKLVQQNPNNINMQFGDADDPTNQSAVIPELGGRKESRVVCVSSAAHQRAPTFRAALVPPTAVDYDPWRNYGLSKLSNILFAGALHRRTHAACGVAGYALHPGVIPTELGRNNSWAEMFYGTALFRLFMKDVGQGASTQVYCLLEDAAAAPPGRYYQDNDVAEPRSDAVQQRNEDALWDASLRLIRDLKPELFETIRGDGIVTLDHLADEVHDASTSDLTH